MRVDVNDNGWNSDEDIVQYALGSMEAYAISVTHVSLNCGANYPGIIAFNHAEALIKFLKHCPKEAQDNQLTVSLCE